jgi:radical SAM superfamily enzyme YgiQ (UPF0313 family)
VDFGILDESLLMDEGRLVELSRLIQRSALPLSFSCAARPDQTISAFALREVAAAGCWQMTFDLGGGTDETLRALGQGVTVRQTIEALQTVRRAGIATKAMLRLGSPGETRQTLEATMAFAVRAPLDDIVVGYFAAFPGAEISRDVEEQGARFGTNVDARDAWVSYVPTGFTPAALRAARRRLYRRFYLRPRPVLQYLRRLREPSCRQTLLSAAAAFAKKFVFRQ